MKRLALLAALALPAAPAAAQGIDMSRGGPVDVTARDGFEWRQNDDMVVASGDARAVRGDVTVLADRLIARYRKKGTGPAGAAQPPPPTATPAAAGDPASDTGSNEIYRLEAEGHVRIFTPTDLAVGDRAVYDIDQAVLVLTGRALKLTTPQNTLTARDAMEYWSAKHMAVGRGDAVVVTNDGRRLAADTLVAFTNGDGPARPAAPAAAAAGAKAPGDPLAASGKLQRVEAFGNVEIRTATETIRGDRGVYVADTGIARIAGNVRVTRGQNQLNGAEAIVNMRTGVSTMTRGGDARVSGLVVPSDASTRNGANKPGGGAAARP